VDNLPDDIVGFTTDDAETMASAAARAYHRRAGKDGSQVILASGVACLQYGQQYGVDLGGIDLGWTGSTPTAVIAVNDDGQIRKCIMITGPDAAAAGWSALMFTAYQFHSGVPVAEREKGVVYLVALNQVQSSSGEVIRYEGIPAWQDRQSPLHFTLLVKKGNSKQGNSLWEFDCPGARLKAAEKWFGLSQGASGKDAPDGRVLCCTSVWRRSLPVADTLVPPAVIHGNFSYVVTYTQVEKVEVTVFDGPDASENAARFAYSITQDRMSGVVTLGIVFAAV